MSSPVGTAWHLTCGRAKVAPPPTPLRGPGGAPRRRRPRWVPAVGAAGGPTGFPRQRPESAPPPSSERQPACCRCGAGEPGGGRAQEVQAEAGGGSLRQGFRNIPRGALGPLDAVDLTDKLVAFDREGYGAEVTATELRDMGMQEEAARPQARSPA